MTIDRHKSIVSHYWRSDCLETSKCKENNTLLFDLGYIYMCTYNDSLKSNSQKCILFDLPYQDTLKCFVPINILLEPPDYKELQYDSDATKQSYFDKWFVETPVTCNTQDKIYDLLHNIQGQRENSGIQYYVTGTIHSSMVGTLTSVAT